MKKSIAKIDTMGFELLHFSEAVAPELNVHLHLQRIPNHEQEE